MPDLFYLIKLFTSGFFVCFCLFEGSLATTDRPYIKISRLLVAAGQNCTEFFQMNVGGGGRTVGETRKALCE